jgi:hypothetical protein
VLSFVSYIILISLVAEDDKLTVKVREDPSDAETSSMLISWLNIKPDVRQDIPNINNLQNSPGKGAPGNEEVYLIIFMAKPLNFIKIQC